MGKENFSLVGVFDGHGQHGHIISNMLKIFFSEYFSKSEIYTAENKNFLNIFNTKIKNTFADMNNIYHFTNNFDASNLNDLIKKIFYEKLIEENYFLIKNSFSLAEACFMQSKCDINFSGSTCISVFLIDDKIICGNCGDSRAILVTGKENQKNEIINLSIDHKPDLKEEANRIIKSHGRVERRSENGIRTGPLRVWLKNENFPGLAMTRSIGDMVASKIGVTSEPEIIECNVTNESKFIVVGSDGIWEILSNEEVASIVNPYYKIMDVESATDRLIEEASKKWLNVNYFLKIIIYFSSKKKQPMIYQQ